MSHIFINAPERIDTARCIKCGLLVERDSIGFQLLCGVIRPKKKELEELDRVKFSHDFHQILFSLDEIGDNNFDAESICVHCGKIAKHGRFFLDNSGACPALDKLRINNYIKDAKWEDRK